MLQRFLTSCSNPSRVVLRLVSKRCEVEGFAVAGSCGGDLNDPACAEPGLTDVLGRFFRSQRPGDVTTMTDLLRRPYADPPLEMGLIDPRMVLPTQTS